jgi:hypothetical protein
VGDSRQLTPVVAEGLFSGDCRSTQRRASRVAFANRMRTVLVWCCGAEGTTRAALIVIGFYAAQLIVLGGLALAATSSLTWRQGDAIPLGRDRTLRVIGIVASREDEPSVLIVEDLASTSCGHWFEPSTAH